MYFKHGLGTCAYDNKRVYLTVVVMAYLKMNHRDSAPHTPRLILLGPTGCGKSVQAELLASKYGLVNGKLTQNVYEQTYLIYGPSLCCARRLFLR